MSKSKKGLAGAEISINGKGVSEKLKNALLGEEDRTYEITEAAIKDDFCNYSYEITEGTGIGDTHKIVGRVMRPHQNKQSGWVVDLGGNIMKFGKIETMKIVQNGGLYHVENNGRQLTNVTFTKN